MNDNEESRRSWGFFHPRSRRVCQVRPLFDPIQQRPSLAHAMIPQGDVFFHPARHTLILSLVKRGWVLLSRSPTWDHLVDVGYNVLPGPLPGAWFER